VSLKKQINLSLFFKNNICSFICSCSMHNLIIYFDMRGHCQLTQITQIFSSGALDATARGRVQVNRRGLRVCITDSPASLHPVPGGSGSDARRRSRQPPQARKKRAAERRGGGGAARSARPGRCAGQELRGSARTRVMSAATAAASSGNLGGEG